MTEMIILDRLTKRFGPFVAVDGISMTVKRGEVLGFLGPNGAGKSTTMKMVTGYLTPTDGSASVQGFDVVKNPIAVKQAIGYLPEGAPTYGDMTTRGFLRFIAEVRGFDGAERDRHVDKAVERVALQEVVNQSVETLSKGFKRRVGLAQAILHDPEILIMDEPTDGLDPNQKHQVRSLIQEMAADKAIVISTHILEEVEAVCSRAVIIARGRLLADGTPEELIARDERHNAVVVTLERDAADGIRGALSTRDDVAGIDEIGAVNGKASLRIRSKGAKPLAVEVGELVRDKGLTPDELYVERGTLDSVFRTITADQASVPEDAPHA